MRISSLATATAAVLLAAAGCASTKKSTAPESSAAKSRFPANVGVQLYSVRNQLKQDLPGTLAQVREMGLTDVELYDFHGQSPAELRKTLEAAGLRARSMHQPFKRFKEDVAGLIADAKALGVTYVGTAWIPHQGTFGPEDNRMAIEVFNRAGVQMKEAGLRLFYHPHGFEFAPGEGGGTLFDDMLARTQPGVVDFQMDVFWFVHGGADPVEYLRKHPERFILTHLKDMHQSEPTGITTGKANTENDVVLGTGKVDIAGVVREAERAGHVHWHFLEDESSRVLEQLPQSLAYLKGLSL